MKAEKVSQSQMGVKDSKIVVLGEKARKGLSKFQDSLKKDIESCQVKIDLAVKEYVAPKTAWEKLSSFLNGSEAEDTIRWGNDEITEKKQIIADIKSGKTDSSINFLIREINMIMAGIRTGLTDKAMENNWPDIVREYIEILSKLNPNEAQKLQVKLNKKTRDLSKSTS